MSCEKVYAVLVMSVVRWKWRWTERRVVALDLIPRARGCGNQILWGWAKYSWVGVWFIVLAGVISMSTTECLKFSTSDRPVGRALIQMLVRGVLAWGPLVICCLYIVPSFSIARSVSISFNFLSLSLRLQTSRFFFAPIACRALPQAAQARCRAGVILVANHFWTRRPWSSSCSHECRRWC